MFAQKPMIESPPIQMYRRDKAKPLPAPPATIEAYAARRGYAFDTAEEAYWNRRICADAYMLFRLLTRLCKERTYCWPGLDYLAERLGTSTGTIKRRLDVLERARLIERKQRPGGLTSYTYVLPLQHYDAGQHTVADRSGIDHDLPPVTPAASSDSQIVPRSLAKAEVSIDPNSERQASPIFFVSSQEISSAPIDRSGLIRQTIKSQNLNPGGGGKNTQSLSAGGATESSRILEQAGVFSPVVLDELKHIPLPQVEACLQFARRQRNIADPAAFAVSLLRLGVGQKLLERKQHRPAKQQAAPTSDCGKYERYHCAHGRIRGAGCPDCDRSLAANNAVVGRMEISAEDRSGVLNSEDSGLSRVWAAMLATLQPQISAVDLETWLRPSTLVELDSSTAIISTPNVFAREQVTSQYSDLIGAALSAAVGRSVQIEVVIGDG